MLRIKLVRYGKKDQPTWRVVVVEGTRTGRGRVVDYIGNYNPSITPKEFKLDAEKFADWVTKGAQPTDAILRLKGRFIEKTKDYQKSVPLKVYRNAEKEAAKKQAEEDAKKAAEEAKIAAAEAEKAAAEAAANPEPVAEEATEVAESAPEVVAEEAAPEVESPAEEMVEAPTPESTEEVAAEEVKTEENPA